MQAQLIAYPPDQPAIVCLLAADSALRIGRARGNGLSIEHPSVSRAHAELLAHGQRWMLRDLGSKNGSFVEGSRVLEAMLDRPCWLRVGDVYCEFTALGPAEVAARESGMRVRRAAATAHTARLDGQHRLDDLLDASLRGVLELAQCERGFVLLGDGDRFAMRASLALDPSRLSMHEFSGSVGAVRRALAQRRSVVANDIGREPWLATRASVAAAELSALVCLPLLDGERILGAIYGDRVRPGPAITTLDLELLEAFAERVALWIAARHASQLLDEHQGASQPQWEAILAGQIGEAP